jgi:hypothetical protein
MNDNIEGNDKPRQPFQQAQQPQPVSAKAAFREGGGNAPKGEDKSQNAIGDGKVDGAARGGGPRAKFDHARFTAGVVGVYEAFLKEPIPEEMVRLVRELGKRERE